VREERVWVPPVYRTECQRVWVEPTYTTCTERVWVPEEYEDRIIIHRRNGTEWREHVRVVISPGRFEERTRQIEVTPGRWEERRVQVEVCPGRWETRLVRDEPRWDHRPRIDWSIDIDNRW
jgi:hypothetical protein